MVQQQRHSGQCSSLTLVPAQMRAQTQHLAQHLARQRGCIERAEAPWLPNPRENRIEPVAFRDTEADNSTWVYSLQIRTRECGYVRIKPKRRRSFGATFRSSNLGTGWGVDRAHRAARRVEHRPVDREMVEPWNQDWESAPVTRKQKQKRLQLQTSTTDHRTKSCFPSVRPEQAWASNDDPTTPADFEPPSPPTLASTSSDEEDAQAGPSRSDEVRKAGYNVLVVEG